jgi:hypothetical protein
MKTMTTTTNKRASRTKIFSVDDFMRIQRSTHLGGAYWFWRQLDPSADADMRSRARAVLRAMSERDFVDNGGVAHSPEIAEAWRYGGVEPLRIARPGELAAC